MRIEILILDDINIFFLFDDTQNDVETYEIISKNHSLINGIKTKYYTINIDSKLSGSLGIAKLNHSGKLLSYKIARQFEHRLESEETAKKMDDYVDRQNTLK